MKIVSRIIICFCILLILFIAITAADAVPILPSLVLAALLGLIPAFIARNKGRDFTLWWFYGFMIWIVAIIHAIAMSPTQEYLDKQIDDDLTLKRCPYCGEVIKSMAIICKHCHMDLRNFQPIELTEIVKKDKSK